MTTNGHDDDGDEDDRAIYARYYATIMRFFRNKVPSGARDEVNELTARTFLCFVEKRARGPLVDRDQQPIRSVKAFLLGIARNILLEHLRALTRASGVEGLEEQSIADVGRSLSSLVSVAERRSCIQECARMLPLYEQLVLECIIHQEMTYLEVAQLLGVPFGTVATYYSRARERLERLYLDHCSRGAIDHAVGGTDEDVLRRAYPWYSTDSGTIDDRKLLAATTRERPQVFTSLPAWYVALEVPRTLPKATLLELSALARSVWQAWHLAGRPMSGVG